MARCSTTSAMRRWTHATTSIAASTRLPALPLAFGTGAKAPLKRNNFGVSVGGPDLSRSHLLLLQLRGPAPASGHSAEQQRVHRGPARGVHPGHGRSEHGSAHPAAKQRQHVRFVHAGTCADRSVHRRRLPEARETTTRCMGSMRSRRTCAQSLLCRVTRCRDGATTALRIARSGPCSMCTSFRRESQMRLVSGFNRISISFNPANLLDPPASA